MNSRTEGRPCDEGVTEMITARGMGPGRSPFMAKADVPGAVVSDRPGRLISKHATDRLVSRPSMVPDKELYGQVRQRAIQGTCIQA